MSPCTAKARINPSPQPPLVHGSSLADFCFPPYVGHNFDTERWADVYYTYCVVAGSGAIVATGHAPTIQVSPAQVPAKAEGQPESEIAKILARIAQTVNQEDDEETPPPPAVVQEISEVIVQASHLMTGSMPEGLVSTFYGEINVTWRNGNDIVRLACFPNRGSILQFGNLAQPLASYQSQPEPNAQNLATRLDALNPQAVR
jgi:hypothetical protein